MSECSGPECDRPAKINGLCRSHYKQQWKGQELAPLAWSRPHYKEGDKVFHWERPCTFVTAASKRYLMFAALMKEKHGQPPDDLFAVIDGYVGGNVKLAFVIYDDDGSIGVLRPHCLNRKPTPARGGRVGWANEPADSETT